jgi:endonuclease/exonuclease/phosphatase family metal-dependent hydrolase
MPALAAVDNPPAEVVAQLAAVRAGLNATALPARDAAHLLIGTWNIRALGDLTPKWRTTDADSPKRNLADICCLAEIIGRLDVCAVQETRGNLTGLLTLLRRLGPQWGVIVTDAGEGAAANDERLAYLFSREAVRPSGLAGELVIDEATFGNQATPLRRQFARPPFMVSFEAGTVDAPIAFTLMSLHINYGHSRQDRTPEITTFADRLKKRAADGDDFNANLIALGDFNIDGWDDANGRAFTSTGLSAPFELLDLPRTIFDTATERHFYDQIAWFTAGNREQLTLQYTKQAGLIDWTQFALANLSKVSKSWRISDHYPLWAQFAL